MRVAWKSRVKQLAWSLAVIAVCGATLVLLGAVPIAASRGHWDITAWFLHVTMRHAVAMRTLGVEPPPLDDAGQILLGAAHYETGCRFCHGAPGRSQPAVAQGMTPAPPRLSQHVPKYDAAALFYIVQHGIKFTGMPAFPVLQREDEVWAVVAFLQRLPELSWREYDALVHPAQEVARTVAPALVSERCARCHGLEGQGRTPGVFPKLAGQHPQYMTNALRAYASGERPSGVMRPIAAALSEAQRRAVVDWYAGIEEDALGRAAPRAAHPSPPAARGRAIAHHGMPERGVPPCQDCHGPEPEAPYQAYPKLAGQHAAYLEKQLSLFAVGVRGGSRYGEIMREVVSHGLSSEEARAVSRYYASLSK